MGNSQKCVVCGGETIVFHDMHFSVTSDCKPYAHGAKVFICQTCSLLQKHAESIDKDRINQIYQDYTIYWLSDGIEQKKYDNGEFLSRSELILNNIAEDINGKKSFLDFGCGSGTNMKTLRKRYQDADIFGFDKYIDQKVKMLPSFIFFDDAQCIERKFDCIMLLHVLEHVEDPVQLLGSLSKYLHDEGVLVVQVPNIKTDPFDIVVFDHVVHYDAINLVKLLKIFFKNVEIPKRQISKELTILASNIELKTECGYESENLYDINHIYQVEECLQNFKGKAYLLGASITAIYFALILGDKCIGFVDEDTDKHGKQLCGKPIVGLSDIDKNIQVIIPFFDFNQVCVIKNRYSNLNLVSLIFQDLQ